MTETRRPSTFSWLSGAILLLLCATLGLHLQAALLTPAERFTPDSMNYVDVARNILRGRGIAQSTLGFNEYTFSPLWTFPRPLTTQPPLYPILIALAGWLGVSLTSAAVALPWLAVGVLWVGVYALARQLYAPGVAWLAVILVGSLYPLVTLADVASTEPLALAAAALALAAAVRARRLESWQWAAAAGLCAGLAFAARYALAPLFLAAAIPLCAPRAWRATLRRGAAFGLGVALPAGAVVLHNWFSAGNLLGPERIPSTLSLRQNLSGAYHALFGSYLGNRYYWLNPFDILNEAQTAILWGLLAALLLGLLWRRGLRATLFAEQRYTPWLWSAIYLVVLVVQRSLVFFDPISARLTLPAAVGLAITLAGMFGAVVRLPERVYQWTALLWAALACLALLGAPAQPAPLRGEVEKSERLRWVRAHVGEEDLVIGEDAMDIPFYFDHERTISYSPYPYTNHPVYADWLAYIDRACSAGQHNYLVLREHPTLRPIDLLEDYGPFIAALYEDNLSEYPRLRFVANLADARIFEFSCPAR